jgi:riboflavin biosynthesis pyrimidine reductase
MVGANTIIADDPSLRLKYVEGRNPDRIVVDGT